MQVTSESRLSPRQQVLLRVFTAVWFIVQLLVWSWWLQPGRVGEPAFYLLVTVALGYLCTGVPGAYLLLTMRMRQPRPLRMTGTERVALVVYASPECGESVLRSVIGCQQVAGEHDTWLIDDGCAPGIRDAARQAGVRYFAPLVHSTTPRDRGPFQAGTRGGALNAWLDQHAKAYDVLVHLDAGQVPGDSYLTHVLGYFRDPAVAWVQSPVLDWTVRSWLGRGVAELRAAFQGPVQTGLFGLRETPLVSARHGAVRVSAILDVGGFRPEGEAADRATLLGSGYRGVYVPRVLVQAVNEPALARHLREQVGRAWSTADVLTRGWFWTTVRRLSWLEIAQLLFVGTLRTGSALAMLMLAIGAAAAVGGTPVVTGDAQALVLALVALGFATFAAWHWTSRWHLPEGVSLSWRGMAVGALAWPATLVGTVAGLTRVPRARRAAAVPTFVPAITRRQRWLLAGLVGLWVVALGTFWTWWLQDKHVFSYVGIALNSALLLWTTVLPGWYFYFVLRMRRPNPALPLPRARVAMVVTKAPSEPWGVVEKTLRAMLDQDFPYAYDVWLADEDASPSTRAWCARNGVQVSCRKGVAGYNNPVWPAREKCKEGNLRYFYDVMGGSHRYDLVVQLDADHVPTRTYLREMIRPFADPSIGYVAAPSICDANAHESWSARARLYAEATLHGSLQAGYNGDYAPLCIGSHYAVRTLALHQINGLGPELAEDHTTTLMMNAHGWRGAFALDAIAHGDGPASLADCLTQEFQWSRSLAKTLLAVTPSYWTGLTRLQKIEFGFAQVWYPLFALHLLVAYLVPIMALVNGMPWVNVNLQEFIVRSSLLTAACVAPVMYVKRAGLLRPAEAKVMSWEMMLFQLLRWPWVLWGVTQATIGWLLGKDFAFKVTPKGVTGVKPLPTTWLVPSFLMVLLQAGTAILISDAGEARGYYYFALLNALTYTVAIVAALALHVHENREALRGAWRTYMRRTALVNTAASLAVALLALTSVLRGNQVVEAFVLPDEPTEGRADSRQASALLRQAAGQVASEELPQVEVAGVTVAIPAPVAPIVPDVPQVRRPTRPLVLPLPLPKTGLRVGAYDPWQRVALGDLDVQHWYVRQDDPELLRGALAAARNRSVVMVTVEPYPALRQRTPVLDAILLGEKDDEIRRLAEVVRASAPQQVLVRWGHEMELSGLYPWSANDPAMYREAYRRVVGIFRAAGADNVSWVWSPAGNDNAGEFYPGADVVDYVGLTVLSDADWDARWGLPRQTFAQIFEPRRERLAGFGKPFIIAELGVSGSPTEQTAWLADAAASLRTASDVRAVMYFNDKNPPMNNLEVRPDWRIDVNQYASFEQRVVQVRQAVTPGGARVTE